MRAASQLGARFARRRPVHTWVRAPPWSSLRVGFHSSTSSAVPARDADEPCAVGSKSSQMQSGAGSYLAAQQVAAVGENVDVATSGPLCDDPMSCYMSVYQALKKLSLAPVLGDVVNGATVWEEEEEEAEEEKESAHKRSLTLWGRDLGKLFYAMFEYDAFACGGTVTKENDTPTRTTTYHLQVVQDGKVVKAWPLSELLPVEEILPFCSLAGFGDLKTQTTVVDPSVRTAFELLSQSELTRVAGAAAAAAATVTDSAAAGAGECAPAGDAPYTFKLVHTKSGSRREHDSYYYRGKQVSYVKAQEDGAWFGETIERNIHLELFPGGIALVPYKMNIYGPGGFFKSHVDTPTLDPARMLGTVVVALPSSFEGGVMSVAPPSGAGATAAGEGAPPSVRFDWAPHMAGNSVSWAAFFGDCVHEVQPVTTGYRVTITYGMVATGSKSRWWASGGCSTIARAPATTELHAQRLVQHVATAPVSRFGMVLTHKYTLTGVSATMLKGVDRVLYNALAAAGYKLTVRPVVFASRVIRPCEGDDSDGFASNKIYAFGREELAAIRRGVSPPSAAEKLPPIPFVRCTVKCDESVRENSALGVKVYEDYTAACEHTGNCSEPENDEVIYFSAALIVERP